MSVGTHLGIADPALGQEEGPNDLMKTPPDLSFMILCLSFSGC